MNSGQSVEALIRRHEAGDRDPELLRQLDALASNYFLERSEEGCLRPIDLLEDFLNIYGQPFFRSDERTYTVLLPLSEVEARSTQMRHVVEGPHDEFYRFSWRDDRTWPMDRYFEALCFANKWNRFLRWPRAIVEGAKMDDEGRYTEIDFVLDCQLDLSAGMPKRIFFQHVNAAIESGMEFWIDAQKAGF